MVTQMMNSFQQKKSEHVDVNDIEELCTLLAELTEQNKSTTLTNENGLKFCKAIARCKEYFQGNSRTVQL